MKYNNVDELQPGDIIFATNASNQLVGIETVGTNSHVCNLRLYGNTQGVDYSLFLIKMSTTGVYYPHAGGYKLYDLNESITFVNDLYILKLCRVNLIY